MGTCESLYTITASPYPYDDNCQQNADSKWESKSKMDSSNCDIPRVLNVTKIRNFERCISRPPSSFSMLPFASHPETLRAFGVSIFPCFYYKFGNIVIWYIRFWLDSLCIFYEIRVMPGHYKPYNHWVKQKILARYKPGNYLEETVEFY